MFHIPSFLVLPKQNKKFDLRNWAMGNAYLNPLFRIEWLAELLNKAQQCFPILARMR